MKMLMRTANYYYVQSNKVLPTSTAVRRILLLIGHWSAWCRSVRSVSPPAARLPAALKIVGTSLLLIPLSPLFMAPLAHGGSSPSMPRAGVRCAIGAASGPSSRSTFAVARSSYDILFVDFSFLTSSFGSRRGSRHPGLQMHATKKHLYFYFIFIF